MRIVSCLLALALAACGGDYDAGLTDVVILQAVPDAGGSAPMDAGLTLSDTATAHDTPALADPGPAPDAGPPVEEDTKQLPPWVAHEDPEVEQCLAGFPLLCDKLVQCGESQPLLGLFSGFCGQLMDSVAPQLVDGCEQIGTLIGDNISIPIPIGDGGVQGLINQLIQGCVENFDCTQESLTKFGERIGAIAAAFGEGGNTSDALPALIDLAASCGVLDDLFPFFP